MELIFVWLQKPKIDSFPSNHPPLCRYRTFYDNRISCLIAPFVDACDVALITKNI